MTINYFSSMIILAALATFCQIGNAAYETTICDCSARELIGTLRHDLDPSCILEPTIEENEISYTVRRKKEPTKTYRAYICSKWIASKSVTTFLFGGRDTVPHKPRPVSMTRQECFLMATYKNCKGETMTQDGSTFVYKGEPTGEGAWWATTTYTTTNCVLEETTVEKRCSTCPTTTVWGTLTVEPEREYAEHNHMMYIWNRTEHIGESSCRMEVIHQGSGHLRYPATGPGYKRVRDRKKQLDFILSGTATRDCDSKEVVFEVLNAPGTTISYSHKRPTGAPEVHLTTPLGEHLQYIGDTMLERINGLRSETRILECEIRALRRNQVVNAAQLDGILAAEQMGLPRCHLVEGYGDMATVWRCRETKELFLPRNGSCGIEPATGRMTLAKNGWTLIPYKECTWRQGLANFNGAFHLWNSTAANWSKIEPNLDVAHGPLMKRLDIDVDNWDQWVEKNHPSIDDTSRRQLDQLLSMMAENNPDLAISDDTTPFVPWITPDTPTWKKACYIILAILAVATPIACVWYCCGKEAVMPCIWGCLKCIFVCGRCCKHQKTRGPPPDVSGERMLPAGIV